MRLAYTVPTCEPRDAVSGDSLQWDVSYPDYPASDGWQLAYYINGPEKLDLPWGTRVTANGDGFSVRVPASAFDLLAGDYSLSGRVSLSGEEHRVYKGKLLIQANPASMEPGLSFNRQMRDALRTAVLAAAPAAAKLSVQVNGHAVTYSREEARKDLAHYEALVVIEENPAAEITHEPVFLRG